MELRAAALGGVLLVHALGSHAITLGALQGNSWLGRRLDVAVAAQLDPGQAASSVCATADVFHADALVDRSRVQVTVEPSDRPQEVWLRVVSSAVVDEPIVTIRLRVGCDSEVVRRYTLLPDAPSELIPPPPIPPRAVVGEVPPTSKVDRTDPTATPPSPAAKAANAPRNKAAPADTANAAVAKRKPVVAKREKQALATPTEPATRAPVSPPSSGPVTAPGAGRGKLTLEPVIIPLKREEVAEPPPQPPAQTEEQAQTAKKMEDLQSQIKNLLDQAAANAENQRALLARLQKAEEARAQDSLVYWFAAVLAVCLLGTVVYLRRSAQQLRLLQAERLLPGSELDPGPHVPTSVPKAHTFAPAIEDSDALADSSWLGVDDKGLSVVVENAPTQVAELAPSVDLSEPHVPVDLHATDFNAEDQIALIDQAQLFVRLDKASHAIDILEERIRHKSSDCPLVFLALLRIANEANLKVDFRQFRDEMQQVFNVAVPEFALFKAEGRKLQDYTELHQHLEKLGRTPQALTEIEACLVLSAWGNNTDAFDLAAFKDLVKLHGVIYKSLQPNHSTLGTLDSGTSQGVVDVDLPL